jgi:hypothetical protein
MKFYQKELINQSINPKKLLILNSNIHHKVMLDIEYGVPILESKILIIEAYLLTRKSTHFMELL